MQQEYQFTNIVPYILRIVFIILKNIVTLGKCGVEKEVCRTYLCDFQLKTNGKVVVVMQMCSKLIPELHIGAIVSKKSDTLAITSRFGPLNLYYLFQTT